MPDTNNLVKPTLFLPAAVLLSACALSPQTIQISPDLNTDGIKPVSGATLALDVQDQRRDRVVGYRGGIYDTAAITTRDDVTLSIRAEMARVLSGQGFTIVSKGAPATAGLDIELQQLNYTARQDTILWNVEIFAVINARASAGTRTISNNFEDRFNKDFPKSPSTFDNEKLINEVVSRLLQRIIQDESVMKLLSTGRS